MDTGNARHWSLTVDADRIAWLTLDRTDSAANALSREVMEELIRGSSEIELEPPRGLVIVSAKSGFIAGADVREFAQVRTPEEAAAVVRAAHAILQRLERLPCPTVAAINGYCLGGGLELALACRYRVCVDDPKTVLGLPEVMLGIHPGFGGTVRSVRLVGVTAAMDLMLTGQEPAPRQGPGARARRSARPRRRPARRGPLDGARPAGRADARPCRSGCCRGRRCVASSLGKI